MIFLLWYITTENNNKSCGSTEIFSVKSWSEKLNNGLAENFKKKTQEDPRERRALLLAQWIKFHVKTVNLKTYFYASVGKFGAFLQNIQTIGIFRALSEKYLADSLKTDFYLSRGTFVYFFGLWTEKFWIFGENFFGSLVKTVFGVSTRTFRVKNFSRKFIWTYKIFQTFSTKFLMVSEAFFLPFYLVSIF